MNIRILLYITVTSILLQFGFGQRSSEKRIDSSQADSVSDEEIQSLLDELDESFYILKDNYVDEINDPEIIKSGIKGLFRPLDPYTVYLEGSRKDRLEMLTKGKYGGVGIQINTRRDTLIITGVMEDSPAYSEGLSIGDKIIMVDSISTIGYSTSKVSKLIKGEKGTIVTLGIYRPSTKRKYSFELTRAQIVVKDVPYYGIDEDGIGYVRITKFSRSTARDFRDAMKSFAGSDNLNGIVIDLRNNSGGLLRNALSILDNLTEKNTLLLSTRGRNKASNSKKYARQKPIIDIDIPVAVLINKGSASASEIVAGTLQDLDRAVLIGDKSFGKGLVQSMFSINDSTKLKLTTAKYYTPSGRLIQKYDYLDNGVLTDGLDKRDSTFYTIGGRQMNGGGGITPDIPVDRDKIPPYVVELWRQGLFLTFAASYVPTRNIEPPIVITSQILSDFEQFLTDYHFKYYEPGEKEFNKMKKIIKDNEEFDRTRKRSIVSAIAFWKKDPQKKLFSDLENYYHHKKENPFKSPENLQGIRNGLYREMSSVVTGLNSDRVRAALSYDNIYKEAKEVLLDSNRYYDILSPAPAILDTADDNQETD